MLPADVLVGDLVDKAMQHRLKINTFLLVYLHAYVPIELSSGGDQRSETNSCEWS